MNLRVLCVVCAAVLQTAAQPSFYQAAIDQDQLAGAPDFSFLNHPLEAADRLFVRDGHFHRLGADLLPNTADDERVRLFGVNLAFGANFPAEADAERIAKRLRRLGVNLVRLHHMDSQPDANPGNAGSLLTRDPYPTLNPVAVARLRRFLDALKAEGIYCNLNLHVGYQFRPSVDGVPAMPPGVAFPSQSKPLHVFYPRMVELQAEYARQALEALALKDDPVLAMVEIDNESSLAASFQNQWSDELNRAAVGEYRDELARQWNAFLGAKYGSTDALRAAWGAGVPDGPNILPGEWRPIELHDGAQATVEQQEDGSVRVEVTRKGGWVILKQVGFSIAAGRPYVAEVEIRADLPAGVSGSIYWDVKRDVSPWDTLKGINISVTGEWQKFTMLAPANFAIDGAGRFGLSVEKVGAAVYVRNCSLRPAGERALGDDESLEAANVALVGQNDRSTEARLNDYLLFLADRDRAYLKTMLDAVREKTDALAPVAGTQMGYGGLLNLDSHQDLNYDDNHFYVDHYSFPNTSWDGRDWLIRDDSSLGSGLGSFQNMAAARTAGRPYTVSEYNQPWPNTHAAEIDPTLAAFAAFQDWDAIVHFAYSHGRGWDDGVPNGFNINGDWTKFPNIGQSAWLFRSGAIQAGREAIDIPVSGELRLRAARERRGGSISSFLASALGFNASHAFLHPVRLVKDGEGALAEAAQAAPQAPFTSDTGEIVYDRERKLFLIGAPMAAGVFGFVGQNQAAAGAIEVELAPAARGFAAVLVTALDQQPIASSTRLLLSNPGYTLRTQPGSDPPRPQQLVKYGSGLTLEPEPGYPSKPSGNLNGGQRPVWMERVEAFVTLRTEAGRITVYPLDGSGARLDALSDADVQPVAGGFRIHLQADGQPFTPWYEIESQP